MSGFLIDKNAQIKCSHSAPVTIVTSNAKVQAGGAFLATAADTFLISASDCPFVAPPPTASKAPCIQVQWMVTALKVQICGQPALLSTGQGMVITTPPNPPAPPVVVQTQAKVQGT